MFRFLFAVGVLMLPVAASADYLYGLNKESGAEPYVLLVTDVSEIMEVKDAGCPAGYVPAGLGCRSGTSVVEQLTRMEALKQTLARLIPQMDNVVLGMSKFGVKTSSSNSCGVQLSNPLPTTSKGKPPTQDQLLATVNNMKSEGGTPIGQALEDALAHLKAVRAADPAVDSTGLCRNYAVVVVTNGTPDCDSTRGGTEPKNDDTKAYANVAALRALNIPTYVVAFGKDTAKNISDGMARRGGTARMGSSWCPKGSSGACTSGAALSANTAGELLGALQTVIQEVKRGSYTVMPAMVATVPQEKSEYDRVSQNFLTYSAFEMPDYRGRLYGIRLFQEDEEEWGKWEFTDLSDGNEEFSLKTCGAKGNPCVFEAGELLQKRTTPRRILFAEPVSTDTTDGSLVMTMGAPMELPEGELERQAGAVTLMSKVIETGSPLRPGFDALPAGDRVILEGMASSSSVDGPAWRKRVVEWIEGSGRPWKLGDIYHSAPGIVTEPPYSYRGYGYPTFKANHRNRPPMIYVGANDGQIHAFHASDDHFPELADDDETGASDGAPEKELEPRWRAGEEAWSYVPFNMLAKVSLAAIKGADRVFSQDLSCRIDDILAVDTAAAGGIDCTLDEEHEERKTCGWRTVMICGQGWGGSWYVALDITEPLNPRPLWEATHRGNGTFGLGRSWVVPSVGAVNMEATGKDGEKYGVPTWLAIYGSGYNTRHRDHNGVSSLAYRYLNMPFAGAYPEHGAGIQGENGNSNASFVYVQHMYSGKYLKVIGLDKQYGVTADIPLVGTDDPFFINAGYVGGWRGGTLDRISLPTEGGMTRPDLWGYCPAILSFSNSKPLTSRPSAFSSPNALKDIYLFVGSGLDPGSDPDQQANQGKMWEFMGFNFRDDGTSKCPSANSNLCGNDLKTLFKGEGDRIISPPTLAIQPDAARWLTFTTWTPSEGVCGGGTSYLYCFDVLVGDNCGPCGVGVDEDVEGSISVKLDSHKSQTPVAADGQIYVIGAKGAPNRIGNPDGKGLGIGGKGKPPNANAPRAMVLSWREIF